MRRPLTWLDVFTATPTAGNGLAVVHDADALSDAQMDAVARETDLSETTFVQRATQPGADYRNRIWVPGRELDFAGHPSLGTAVAVALVHGRDRARYVQQTPAGLQPIDVRRDGARWQASMLQGPAGFGDELDPALVLAAAGLGRADAHPALPAQLVSTGLRQVIAPVVDRAALDRTRPDAPRLRALLAEHGATVLYLVALAADDGGADARGFFVAGDAVREDPATGSAAGPLMAYVHARTGVERLHVAQGAALGRPSAIACAVEGDRVRVGGDVVVLIEGTIAL